MHPTALPRVAFVCPFGFRPKATVGTRILPMAQALRRRGYDTALFVPPWDDPASAASTDEREGVPVTQVALNGGLVPTLRRLYSATAAFAPHILHFSKPVSYGAATAWLALWRRRLGRRVALVLDADDWEAEWLASLPYSRWRKAVALRQERWSYAHADAVTVASEALGSIALALRGGRGRVFAVPNAWPGCPTPVTPGEIAAVRREYGFGDATVLLYTRFAEYPPGWPAAVLAALRRSHRDAHLLVVGEGLHGEGKVFRRAVEAAGLTSAVTNVGWPGSQRARACLAAATVAIVPYDDTLLARTKCSVKLLELMGLGVPVVASAVGENVRYLGYGAAGRLIAGLDPEAWAAAIAQMLDKPSLRAEVSAAARRRLGECYVWDRVADSVEEAYRSVWPAERRDAKWHSAP